MEDSSSLVKLTFKVGIQVCIISKNEFRQLIQVAFGSPSTTMESESSSQRRSLASEELPWSYLQIFRGLIGLDLGPNNFIDAESPKWSLVPRGEIVKQLLMQIGLVVNAISIVDSELSVTRVCPVRMIVSEN